MTNKEILTKAINKAVANGWNKIDGMTFTRGWVPDNPTLYGRFNTIETGNAHVGGSHYELNTVIFNHDFAKALWPPQLLSKVAVGYSLPAAGDLAATHQMLDTWQYHLQQMVVADDPIEYLGKNL